MQLTATPIEGLWLVEVEPFSDHRGSVSKPFCRESFREHGLVDDFAQSLLVRNDARGTLRGMHYQVAPSEEVKVVQCLRGRLHDVVLDLRPTSFTYGQWTAVELDAALPLMLYVPRGCAHGYQTLEPGTEAHYLISARHDPSAARTVRWDDPHFAIAWPLPDPILSEEDRHCPDFSPSGAPVPDSSAR